MGSIKVAVRVRPFIPREIEINTPLCIQMQDKTTFLIDVLEGKRTKSFTYDFSFWSHDGYNVQENGYFASENEKYMDQKKVFQSLGEDVLNNAWEGYNCCCFAYGQTGSGKSYSMVGYGINKGIIPIACEEIFNRINKCQDNTEFQVSCSMLEIYNEKIQDLLIHPDQRPAGGLKIREHKMIGVFVDGIEKTPVNSYEEIEQLMEIGNENRTIGATLMNATSSRAHTITTIEIKQIQITEDNMNLQRLSVIHLVDLAGSEKAGKTGATGDRLKEGCAINKSLVVLGQVIKTLADKTLGKAKGEVIPFRDSVLTRILQNALGGNSKTVMIAAISPAFDNFDETLSTLRYADRAKHIQNKAVINESPQDKIIRELKEENDKLREQLNKILGNQRNLSIEAIEQIQESLDTNEALMREQSTTWQQKRRTTSQTVAPRLNVNLQNPHLTNLNEDPQLTNRIQYSLETLPVIVGRKEKSPDIILAGIGIQNIHCKFDYNEEYEICIQPLVQEAERFLYVNGKMVKFGDPPQKLRHLDRIILGTNSIFIFINPGHEDQTSLPDLTLKDVDYDFAIQEKMEASRTGNEKLKELDSKFSIEEQHAEKIREEEQRKYEAKLQEIRQVTEGEIRQKIEIEYQQKLNELQSSGLVKKKEQKKKDIEQKLAKVLPQIKEANLISKELKRNVNFHIKLINIVPEMSGRDPLEELKKSTTDLRVEVNSGDFNMS